MFRGTIYFLMNKDIKVLKFIKPFSVLEDVVILEVYRRDLIPYLIKYDDNLLGTWLSERTLPTNREHLNRLLNSVDLIEYDYMKLLEVNNGCSLNDTYWIKRCNTNFKYDSNNYDFNSVSLYRGFNESLGLVSFFGNSNTLEGALKTPEVTTQGVLPKAWRLVDNKIYLYKKSSHMGLEPYMEVIASDVAMILGINHVPYKLSSWKGEVCSVCPLFTDETIGYLPMAEYLKANIGSTSKWTYSTLKKYLPSDFIEKINDMIVFDFIIENTDRHFNNFGFLIDNNLRTILDIAPLFDNGMSLHSNKTPSIDEYSKELTNKGTFDIYNLVIAKEIIKSNPKKYKGWSELLRLNISSLDKSINQIPNVSRRTWVRRLLLDRCDIINSL